SRSHAAIMIALWVTFAQVFYVVLRLWGHELHDVHDFSRLAEITSKHLHNIRLIPDDFAASLAIYKKNLALEYLTGYVGEYALSVDHIFRMVPLLTSFGVPSKY